jgi:hypothetical protein
MDGDLQLAAGRRLHVLGELDEILGMEIVRRVGARQVPLCLRGRTGAGQDQGGASAGHKLQ